MFCAVAIWSLIDAAVKLNKPGVSREMRVLLFKRHVIYILFYGLFNFYYAFLAVVTLKNQDKVER